MEDEKKCDFDINIFDIQGLGEIKKRPDIIPKIKLDVTPQMVMEPRFHLMSEDIQKLRDIAGYMFYIESQSKPPALMLMKVGKSDITTTVGMIEEVPPEFLQRAMENPVDKPAHGMYAITDEIREWLKKELGL